MIIFQTIFFTCLFFLFWIYAGYPFFLFIISRFNKKKPIAFSEKNFVPLVTILIPAYNEEKVISKKIENTLTLDYPRDRLEIIVISDDSKDRTNGIVESFGYRANLLIQSPRQGKAAAINLGIKKAKGDIVVVTDANAMLGKDVVSKVVRHFIDPKVGGVTGSMRQINVAKTAISEGGGLYWRYEKSMRRNESALHSVVSMSGEISVFRKNIFLKDGVVAEWYVKGGTDDMQMTIFIIRSGYRVLYDSEANVWEPAPDNLKDLFSQKVRIITQTIVNVKSNFDLLYGKIFGWYGLFIFLSRRVLPLLSPFLLMAIFGLNFILIFAGNSAYFGLFVVQLFFYVCALLGFLSMFSKNFLFKNANFLFLLNATIFMAWVNYFRKIDFTKWQKIESSRI